MGLQILFPLADLPLLLVLGLLLSVALAAALPRMRYPSVGYVMAGDMPAPTLIPGTVITLSPGESFRFGLWLRLRYALSGVGRVAILLAVGLFLSLGVYTVTKVAGGILVTAVTPVASHQPSQRGPERQA